MTRHHGRSAQFTALPTGLSLEAVTLEPGTCDPSPLAPITKASAGARAMPLSGGGCVGVRPAQLDAGPAKDNATGENDG